MSKIDALLKIDPLAVAEKITGISYKDKAFGEGLDNPATALGLLLMQAHAKEKEAALRETNDTVFSNELPRYLTIIEKFGFEQVLADEWQSTWGPTETLYIFAHRKGLLLSFDTFGGNRVNAAKVYYNWKPSIDEWWDCRSSGHMTEGGIWVGDHDAREALIHNLNKLNNRGAFVSPWAERPFLWLLNFDEPKVAGYDYRAITEARIARLPDWVKATITPRMAEAT